MFLVFLSGCLDGFDMTDSGCNQTGSFLGCLPSYARHLIR